MEDPSTQVAIPAGMIGSLREQVPDLATHVRYGTPGGHVQMAGVLRQLRFDGEGDSPDLSATGWGFNASFLVRPWKHGELMGNFAYGQGIGRYVESFSGQNADAVITAADDLETIPIGAGVIGYVHHWGKQLRAGMAVSGASVDPRPEQPGSAMKSARDVRVNLLWSPVPLLDYGLEVLWGRRVNVDGAEGRAWRLMFAAVYHLN